MGIRISVTNDLEHADKIMKMIKENDGYCPCKLEKIEDNKCMCKEFMEMEEGECHCKLYIKTKIDD